MNEVQKPEKIFICPRCGKVRNVLTIKNCFKTDTINPEYEGSYCFNCYARWISENVSKVEIKEDNKNE